jgi:diguanylate cyclase (GGDEF)-like protein/PAS domain S-box-containing protein
LIVDDDALLRGMAAKTLLHAGFQVSEAASGEDALARIGEVPYDVILLDVMMSGIDGYEVCQRIRAMEHGARVPILMLTGLNDTASIELAYSHGATDFITKPINWTLLSHKVRYALRASTAAEAMRRGRESLARAQSLAGMANWTVFADGRIETSAELLRLFGIPGERDGSTSTNTFLELVMPADRDRVGSARARLAHDGTPYQLEYRIKRDDGTVRTLFEQAAPVPDEPGRCKRFDGITQDITERVQAQERIQQLAHYDGTTGLPNRQFFAQLAAPSLERAARSGTGCAVLHLDIDRFKSVNDAFGRSQGDLVLKTVAERLRSWIRGSDLASTGQRPADRGMLASVGGNAFNLVITDLAGQEQATIVAQRLLKVIAEPIIVESQSLVMSASIGIAFFPNDAQDFPGLTHCAEQAVHAAKDAGRAQHRFFDEQMNAHAASRLRLEASLRGAIDQNELRLHFQPKVDANSGAVVGAEALVRWQHSERGIIPPGEFIPLAEETGLILPLTDWVLETACRSLREWSDAGLPIVPLSVNLAAPSLTGVALVGKLDALMRRFDLQPECLMLEVTETMLMRDIESGVVLLETLRARGYGLSLDDFGTGYSSMSYLKRLPLDELKIDRAFVTDAARGGRDGALAAAIIALGREFALQVVAEGVETLEQSSFLLRRGCNLQQGYLFARPMPAEAFARLLRRGSIDLAPVIESAVHGT